MADLDGGITRDGTAYHGRMLNILGQRDFPKASCDTTYSFETNSEPGQFVPVHVHPTQDEFILVQEGQLELKLDGKWQTAKAGDLVQSCDDKLGRKKLIECLAPNRRLTLDVKGPAK